jgi:NADH-quinone oxidoreductase subunit J
MDWISQNILLVTALVLIAAGIAILMPKARKFPRQLGWLLTFAGVLAFGVKLLPEQFSLTEDVLFVLFGAGALLCSILMITSSNPVYGALWFAVATLSVCGLFLLQSAPFLAATTAIVYAGAIIVTFLFVIMLAQQGGQAIYDQRSRQPLLATIGAFVLLAALLSTIDRAGIQGPVPTFADAAAESEPVAEPDAPAPEVKEPVAIAEAEPVVVTNALSHPRVGEKLGTMHGLGRSLFGDYLFAVEIAGTLLLIASIGAILIAPKKGQGLQ